MDSRKLALLCRQLAEDKKAEQVVVLDLRKLSSVADYFVIATGTSEPHLRAIVEEISGKLEVDHAISPHSQDGHWRNNWVVLDYFDVVVHLMRADTRERYALEQLWGDAPRLRAARKPRTPHMAAS
jgi:ribosome-associated protein